MTRAPVVNEQRGSINFAIEKVVLKEAKLTAIQMTIWRRISSKGLMRKSV